MTPSEIIKSMQDPSGIPFYPVVFQFLMVLTFAIHIIFVNLTIGSSFLAVYGRVRGGEFWGRMSKTMPRVTTVSISMTILYGIAPLLFLQTLYDPFWYTSNNLSQWWVISFVFILMAAHGLTYIIYMKKDSALTFTSLMAFSLFIFAGVIMHGLNYQMLIPDRWYEWYVRGNSMRTYGTSLHAISIPRLLHFMVPSFAVTGLFLMLYGWYFRDREDYDKSYLQKVAKSGAQLAFYATLVQMAMGIWWLLTLKKEFKLYTEPLFIIAIISSLFLLHNLYFARREPFRFSRSSALLLVITVFLMSLLRELLRMKYVGEYNYSIYNYKLNIDPVSTIIFIVTFLAGVVITGYMIYIAYNSGKYEKTFSPSPLINKWGTFSIILLILWSGILLFTGFILWLK